MKKFFISLMLGFGAALGVFVALAMPPGGWGVAVGVGLGLLGCLPMLVIMMMLIGRGHTDRSKQVIYEEAPQPIIIVQHPGGYDPFDGYDQPLPQPQYFHPQQLQPEPDYYAYAEPGQRRRSQRSHGQPSLQPSRQYPQENYHLPSSRRREQSYNQMQAYGQPQAYGRPHAGPRYAEYAPEEFYAGEYYEQEPDYYNAPPAQPSQYDAFYGSREAGYYQEQPERPRRRPGSARIPSRLDAVEADYRTIGDRE